MNTQDIVMTICNLCFIFGLLSQVVHGFHTKTGGVTAVTTIMTGVPLSVIGVCQITLGLYWSGGAVLVSAALWFVLLWQRATYGGK